jgi:hypothetical protein
VDDLLDAFQQVVALDPERFPALAHGVLLGGLRPVPAGESSCLVLRLLPPKSSLLTLRDA